MKLKVYLTIALVFVLGMLCGGLLGVQIAKSRVQTLTTSSTQDLSRMVLEHLDQDLELSEEQREAIAGILGQAVDEVEPMRTETRRRALRILQKYVMQIGEELSADQRRKLDAMVEAFKRRSNLERDLEQHVPRDP
jgi:hypothetical protein